MIISARFILRILCRTYAQPDLHCMGHIDRRVKNIYFKACKSIAEIKSTTIATI